MNSISKARTWLMMANWGDSQYEVVFILEELSKYDSEKDWDADDTKQLKQLAKRANYWCKSVGMSTTND